MAEFIKTQNSFANGEVSPDFYVRDNLNGLSRMENMDVTAGGGLTRRSGLRQIIKLGRNVQLVPFSVGEDENYILALSAGHVMIYRNSVRVADLLAPWDADALVRLQYAQRFGTIIFVHPDYQPYVLQKTNESFELSKFEFERNDANMDLAIPFVKFNDSSDVKITVTTHSGGNNYATFTTNRNFWTTDNINHRIFLMNKQWVITQYISPTVVVAYTNGPYTLPTSSISDWREAAFSPRRGWPCSITFHQDRLVFGGSRDWPGGIWMSRVGRHTNFDVGTGLDDEAIFVTLMSQQRQQICTVVSSDNLQILTNVGEWAISSKPLTPSVVDVKQHTSVGSLTSRYLPPQKIEGATVFISGGKKDIRELSLDELGENYNANDLCALAKHLMQEPISLAYNDATHQLFVVMATGNMAVLNQNSALGISAWGTYKTAGKFLSVAVIDGETYVAVERTDGIWLERFDCDAQNDADQYDFSFVAAALPMRASGHNPSHVRIRRVSARLLNTKSLFINHMRAVLPNSVYDTASAGYSGDVSVNMLGTQRNSICVPWTLHSSDSLPATILSVTVHGYQTV